MDATCLTRASRVRAHAAARARGRRLTVRLAKRAIVSGAALALVGRRIARRAADSAGSRVLASGNEFDIHHGRHGCVGGRSHEGPRGLPGVTRVENGA
jgi:hypothetical protein